MSSNKAKTLSDPLSDPPGDPLRDPPGRSSHRLRKLLVAVAAGLVVFGAGWTLGNGAAAQSNANAASQAAVRAAAEQTTLCNGYFGTPGSVEKALGVPTLRLDATLSSTTTNDMVCDYIDPAARHSSVAVVLGIFATDPGNPAAVKGTTSSILVSSGSVWGIAASSTAAIVIGSHQKTWLLGAVRKAAAALPTTKSTP